MSEKVSTAEGHGACLELFESCWNEYLKRSATPRKECINVGKSFVQRSLRIIIFQLDGISDNKYVTHYFKDSRRKASNALEE